MFALMDALDKLHAAGAYTLTFTTSDGEAVLTLEGRQVVDVTGTWVSDVTRFLSRRGVDPMDATLAAFPPGLSVGQIIAALRAKGLWTAAQATAAMAAYASAALVPLGWQGAQLNVADAALDEAWVGGVTADAENILSDAICWVMTVPRAFRHLRPGHRVTALPPRTVPAGVIGTGDVYLGLLHGWTLGELSEHLALRWDELLSAVNGLIDADLARVPEEEICTKIGVSARMRAIVLGMR